METQCLVDFVFDMPTRISKELLGDNRTSSTKL